MPHSPFSRQFLNVPAASAAGSVHGVAVLALSAMFVVSANAQAPHGPRALPPGPMIATMPEMGDFFNAFAVFGQVRFRDWDGILNLPQQIGRAHV